MRGRFAQNYRKIESKNYKNHAERNINGEKDKRRGTSTERNMAQHFFIIFETNFLIILSPKGDQRTRDSGRFAQNYRKIESKNYRKMGL